MSQSPVSVLTSLQQLQIKLWLRRAMQGFIRAVWISLLIPMGVMFGYLWAGWEIPWYYWVLPMLMTGTIIFLWSLRPIRLKRVAGRLDKRLDLRARLTTTHEIINDPTDEDVDNPVVQNLLDETEEITDELGHNVHLFNRTLWQEVQALIAVVAILGALLMVDALSPTLPQADPVNIPAGWQEPSANDVEGNAPPLAQSIGSEQAETSPQHEEDFQNALKILADVLRDNAVTHSIADAIDQHDVKHAATELRRLADQLDNLSPQARAELGGLLLEAATRIGNIAPSITAPLQAGSSALANDDLLGAGQALEELARVIEQIEDDPADIAEYKPIEQEQIDAPEAVDMQPEPQDAPPQNTEEQQAEEEPPPEEERLSVEGEPLELESDPETEEKVIEAADPDAQADEEEAESVPFTRQPLISTDQELGADPLVYPWERREIIRRYFTQEN